MATFGLPPLHGALATGEATGVGEARGTGAAEFPQASKITGSVSAMRLLFAINSGEVNRLLQVFNANGCRFLAKAWTQSTGF